MTFSAIIPAADLDTANASLETAGFGPGNFSVPLWRGVSPDVDSYGMNALGPQTEFLAAVEAIPGVSVRVAAPGTVEFDEHVSAEGLSRDPYEEPDQGLPDGDLT